MTSSQTDDLAPRKPLRLWPGVVAVVLQALAWFVVPVVAPDAFLFAVLGGLLGGVVILVWWVFFSRAAWLERVGALVLIVVALVGTSRVVHPSIATGMMGLMLVIYAIPVLSLALVVWAVATRRLPDVLRRTTMVAAILVACSVFTLLRTGGVAGAGVADISWRWSPSPEDRLLSRGEAEPVALPTAPAAPEAPTEPTVPQSGVESSPSQSALATPKTALAGAGAQPGEQPASVPAVNTGADWPGFRGPDRDGIVRGVRIETDWTRFPPIPLWHRPIGPGWSSFAVRGDVLYTQEQRGDDEIVACYKAATGEPVWRHRDAVRFWESNAGAGPRGTPTISGGRVYTLGATGILNALDAADGAPVWSRNVASDTNTTVPTWGFAGSPLVVDDVVIVAAAGTLAAYDVNTGDSRWHRTAHDGSYSSPHRLTIDGIAQVLLASDAGVTSVEPGSGTLLWEHAWRGVAIVQPARIEGGDVLIGASSPNGAGMATRRIAVAHGPGGWTAEERWTSTGLKPYFNDMVVHKGHAFGFDGSILSCIDLRDGKRVWKGGRYGYGQFLLLQDQDVLLVLSEDGGLALVGATPDQFREIARFPGIEGKTWNHPVLAGNILLVRNGEEMAAFRLSSAGR